MNILPLILSTLIAFPAQTDIHLEVVAHSDNHQWAIFAPHENENVVNKYVAEKTKEYGGTFVVLRQHGQRNIKFTFGPETVAIDPNRLFSEKGIKRSIQQLNPALDEQSTVYNEAVKRAQLLADLILDTMKAEHADSWIAIHNNTNGYDGDGKNGIGTISIKRYQKKLADGAKYLIKVHNAGLDEDDLFFITESGDFNTMQNAGWNVVLQNPAVATDPNEDDGSLSVLAEKVDKRYINIEAERSQGNFGKDSLRNQKSMVDLTFKIVTNNQDKRN